MSKPSGMDHPLLDELRRAAREANRLFSHPWRSGMGDIGLFFYEELTPRPYERDSPLNSWAFAGTGAIGVHFSLLANNGRIGPTNPICVTIPGLERGSFIVGEDLFDFLCLGSRRGFFLLEALAYDLPRIIRTCTDPTMPAIERFHLCSDEEQEEYDEALLNFLRERFGLRPWTDPGRFDELQARFGRDIVLPPQDFD